MLAREFIAAVFSDNTLEVLHGEVVGVVLTWSLECDCEGGVEHLLVSLVDERRSEIGFIAVGDLIDPGSGN